VHAQNGGQRGLGPRAASLASNRTYERLKREFLDALTRVRASACARETGHIPLMLAGPKECTVRCVHPQRAPDSVRLQRPYPRISGPLEFRPLGAGAVRYSWTSANHSSANFALDRFSDIGLRVRTTHCVALSTLIFATVKNNMLLSSLEVEGVIIHVAHDALSQT
jgi:hypothetical protein